MIKEQFTDLFLPYPDHGDRLIRVFVPEHEENESLPVIYMTDGQNLFDEKTAVWGCWKIPETIRGEIKNSGKTAVIVGIFNDSHLRDSELTPKSIGEIICPEKLPDLTTPQGEIFDGFIVNTVMPAVEEKFPVKRSRTDTAICGSSSGGLQAFFTALSHPDLFCATGVLSPAFLLYSEEDMKSWIYSKLNECLPYLYIYMGAGDELEMNVFESVEKTYEILTECYPFDKLNEVVLFEEKHHESAWERIFGDFLHTFLERRADF